MNEEYVKKFAKYLVPGDTRARRFIPGESSLLIQHITGGFILHEFKGDELVREMIVDAISPERAEALTLLGEAIGANLPECLSAARSNIPGFLEKVKAYRGHTKSQSPLMMQVYFYAE